MDTLPLFFYTSRQIAQDICSSLSLRAGPSRVIYLSSTRCETGADAAASLSIKDRPVELRCALEIDRSDVTGPSRAHPIFGPDGVILRPGGGVEYRYKRPALPLDNTPEWEPLGIP